MEFDKILDCEHNERVFESNTSRVIVEIKNFWKNEPEFSV